MAERPETDLSTDDEARIDAILRSMSPEDLTLDTPPDAVWAGIEHELGALDEPAGGTPPLAPVVDLASRRRRRMGLTLGAVAAALALLWGVTSFTPLGDDDPAFREVAVAELTYTVDPAFDPGGEGRSASTTLLEAGEAQRIRFDAADLPQPAEDEDVEVWLIGIDDAGEIGVIQTLGLVDDLSQPGEFAVPDDFSFGDYATVAVDLSFEPRDGNEAHSGRSIIRGPIAA